MKDRDVTAKAMDQQFRRRMWFYFFAIVVGALLILLCILTPMLVINSLDTNRENKYKNEANTAIYQWRLLLEKLVSSSYSVAYQLEGFVFSNITKIPNLEDPPEKRLEDQTYDRFPVVADILVDRDVEIQMLSLCPGGVVEQTYPVNEKFLKYDLFKRNKDIMLELALSGIPRLDGPVRSLVDNDQWAVSVMLPVLNTTEHIPLLNEAEENVLKLFWGFVFVEVYIEMLIHHSDLPGMMSSLGLSYLLYNGVEGNYILLASSTPNMTQTDASKFIAAATRIETVNSDLAMSIAILRERNVTFLTSTIMTVLVVGVATLGVLLIAVVSVLISRCLKPYNDVEHAPKSTPFAALIIGPLEGEDMWNLAPDQMTQITEHLGIVLAKLMRQHHGYQIPQVQPYTTTYIFRSVDDAVQMAFHTIEELQRNPIDAELMKALAENGKLLLAYALHWCSDASVSLDVVTGKLRYEGRDVLVSGRLWRLGGLPSTLVISAAAKEAMGPSVSVLVVTERRSCVLRVGEPEEPVYSVSNPTRPLLLQAQRGAEVLAGSPKSANRRNPFARKSRQGFLTGRGGGPVVLDSERRLDRRESSCKEPEDGTDEIDMINQMLLEPHVSSSLMSSLQTAFDQQGILLGMGFNSVRVVVYYFYSYFKILFKPLAAPQRHNIYSRLVSAFGVRQEGLLENLAAHCTIRYLQYQEEAKTFRWNRQFHIQDRRRHRTSTFSQEELHGS